MSGISIPREDVARKECWAMDFVSDSLYNGKRFRALTVIDIYTRECLQINANKRIRGDGIGQDNSKKRISTENKSRQSEFILKAIDAWAYHNEVKPDFARSGKPTDNAHIESFNGSFRGECLNTNWFLSIEDARDKLEAWQKRL